MNPNQQRKLDQLEDELGVKRGTLPIEGEREGYVFTNVRGVTVLVPSKSTSPRGGYIVPALHTYHMPSLDAATRAKELFADQGPAQRKYGHLGPILSLDWKCGNDEDSFCRCRWEPYERRVERSLGYRIVLSAAS